MRFQNPFKIKDLSTSIRPVEKSLFKIHFYYLCPWSVKLAIGNYFVKNSKQGPMFYFFPYGPPFNSYSPFGTPKGARTIIGPGCRIFFNGQFYSSRNGF